MRCACCPESEWWWFRWALAAQPLLAVVLYCWAYGAYCSYVGDQRKMAAPGADAIRDDHVLDWKLAKVPEHDGDDNSAGPAGADGLWPH